MDWLENVGALVLFLTLTYLLNVLLSSLGVLQPLSVLSVLVSAIFSVLIIIVFVQIQHHGEIKNIKVFLKSKGYKEKMGLIKGLLDKKKLNKKGQVDPRLILLILIFIVFYLLSRTG